MNTEQQQAQEPSVWTARDVFRELVEIVNAAPSTTVVEVVRNTPRECKLDAASAALAAKLVIGRMQKFLKG